MKDIQRINLFKRDYKRLKKQGKEFNKLESVIQKLRLGEALEPRYRYHKLSTGYQQARECHIEPDWLLIYKQSETTIWLLRTGSHSELFK